MEMIPEHSAVGRSPLHYGDKVRIHDGSRLDGLEGVVFRIKDGEVQILLDQEVFWFVAEQQLETLK